MSPPMFQFSSPPTSPQQQQQQTSSFCPGTSQNSANRNQQQQPSTSDLSHSNNNNNSSRANPKTNKEHPDCDCSDDEMYEISEKRQSIFDSNATGSGNMLHSHAKKTKLSSNSSIESSSFEEVVVAGKSDDDWLFVEKSKGRVAAGTSSSTTDKSDDVNHSSSPRSQMNLDDTAASSSSYIPNHENADVHRLMRRRCSDSSLLSLRKSGTITIDASSINLLHGANEVKKCEISCRKCGKTKSKIKQEILKLSEQLKSSNKSAEEINAKINEFMEYLESNHASEMTEIEDTQENAAANEPFIPSSSSHDEIEENIFDENEGINVYGSEEIEQISHARDMLHDTPSSSTGTPRRFISLDDIHSRYN
jgi:hypothetical protein